MAEVDWAESAEDDLSAIARFISRDSPAYARREVRGILRAVSRLREMPYSGRKVPDFNLDDVREVIHGAYRVVYRIRGNTCYVMAVVHSSRDFVQSVHREEWPE